MKLDKKDGKFFLRNLKNTTLLKKFSESSVNEIGREKYKIMFTEEELDLLDDELSRLLWEIGVSDDDEVNAQGRYIEYLTDLVYNERN